MREDYEFRNTNGYNFVDFIYVTKEKLENFGPLAGSFAVIKCEGKFLMGFNSLRRQWELPAGKREAGETPKECAVRELLEETGQRVTELSLVGLVVSKHIGNGSIKRNPVYFTEVAQLQPFVENAENTMIMLWDMEEQIGKVDALDLRILACMNGTSAHS
ncbi:DNA mismatch repair protein MutT [Fictibacillus phosphorivorans]|uniref:DNA mismatch repair protein MutT n=1 Tax=Fictibacillus phosphorivorans TaxID=1221500 RepID=A0A160IMP7_9BACL|nr:NUDIX hydrolase [Fictibacillus phosphorivorans]ANC77511.1 DNA mismatch repair protein MutT [Fictibacillus phosphorivorans]